MPAPSKLLQDCSNKGSLKIWQIILIISTSTFVFVASIVIIIICYICFRFPSLKLSKQLQMILLQKELSFAPSESTLRNKILRNFLILKLLLQWIQFYPLFFLFCLHLQCCFPCIKHPFFILFILS